MPPRPPLAQAMRNTRNGLFVVDAAQRIVSWNRGAEQLLGHSADSVLGCPCYEVVAGRLPSGERWCRPNCGVQRRVKQGRLPPAVDIAVVTRDKRTVWLDVACVVLPGRHAPLVAHLLRDVTLEKRHETELDKIRTILAASTTGQVVLSDPRRPVEPNGPPPPAESLSAKRLATLTARERGVLLLLADGLSARAIAERLGISVLTVRSHVANVLHKLGVHRQAAAVAVAVRDSAIRRRAGDLIQTD